MIYLSSFNRSSLCRIFFGLASPVFYAMFYGSMKEQGNVEITDVSAEAFLCLQKYGAV